MSSSLKIFKKYYIMKFMILFAVVALMGSCSNGSSTPPPSVEDEQVSCSQCGGSGYYYGETCQNCLGLGHYNYKNEGGATPSFTGRGHRCRARGCECTISRKELDNAGLNTCGCGDPTEWHF